MHAGLRSRIVKNLKEGYKMFKKMGCIPLLLTMALLLSACGKAAGLPAPAGDVILRVTGDIANHNADDECQFDAALIEQNAVDQTIDDPWMGDGLEYRGALLSKVWELCGGSGEATGVTLVAKDGMTVEIAREDLEQWPIMLAYQVGGADLVDEAGGPVKLVFPAEARETYADEQWMWWVVEVKVQ
jgi:hypothetical protein